MNVLELSDDLLDRALAVRAEQVPPELRAKVHRAVEDAARPRGSRLGPWTGLSALPRPAFGRALWFALLTGLLLVLAVGTLVYLGSLPPTVTPAPITTAPTDPSPTLPSVAPVPTMTPSPRPLPTAGLEVAQTREADFAAHVAASVEQFRTAAPQWYLFATTLDGGEAAQQFIQHWLPEERAWIAAHRPDACLVAPFNRWTRAVTEIDWAVRHVGLGTGLQANPDFPALWAPAYQAIRDFDATAGSACPEVVSFDEFATHVADSVASVKPLASAWYAWVHTLDGYAESRGLSRDWLPAESAWNVHHAAQACFVDSYEAWRQAVRDFSGAAYAAEQSLFSGGNASMVEAYQAKRALVETFDPAALSTC